MNRWLQTRLFTCPKCGARYLHDRGYFHALFQCGRRTTAANSPQPRSA